MRERVEPGAQYLGALMLATAVSAGLLVAESIGAGTLLHGYMLWNIFLAWIPFGLSVWLCRTLRWYLWSSWRALALTAAWLLFLPNSFYMVSDFIHLDEVGSGQILFSAITFTSFILTGLILGITSLYLIHREILRRVMPAAAAGIITVILLSASIAIYIGRDLRWNSWDVLVSPFGLLFDLSERLLHPADYAQVLVVVLPFFALLLSLYFVAWSIIRTARAK